MLTIPKYKSMYTKKPKPPPKTPGLAYRFCPIGKVPPPNVTEIWDMRTGRWFLCCVNFTQPIRSRSSLTMPYGFYRQPKSLRSRRVKVNR